MGGCKPEGAGLHFAVLCKSGGVRDLLVWVGASCGMHCSVDGFAYLLTTTRCASSPPVRSMASMGECIKEPPPLKLGSICMLSGICWLCCELEPEGLRQRVLCWQKTMQEKLQC